MHIHIDERTCTGHGICEVIAPHLFEVGDDGVAHLVGTPNDADVGALLDAVDQCPARALLKS
jgi:ferredoxin